MSPLVSKTIKLGVIGGIAALLLSIANYSTEPAITNLRQMEIQAMLRLLSGDDSPGEREDVQVENVVSKWPVNPDKGWILELTGIGYGGEMTIMTAYDKDGSVKTARLLTNNETVGFGKKAESADYMDIFIGRGGAIPIPRTKSQLGKHVDMVSGATITFSGIARVIAQGSDLVKEWEAQ